MEADKKEVAGFQTAVKESQQKDVKKLAETSIIGLKRIRKQTNEDDNIDDFFQSLKRPKTTTL